MLNDGSVFRGYQMKSSTHPNLNEFYNKIRKDSNNKLNLDLLKSSNLNQDLTFRKFSNIL